MATQQAEQTVRATRRQPAPTPTQTPPVAPRRRRNPFAAVPSAPHTRPGDQNALCLETDQA